MSISVIKSSLSKSWRDIGRNPDFVLGQIATDLLFLVFFGFAFGYLTFNMTFLFAKIQEFFQQGPNLSQEMFSSSNIASVLSQYSEFNKILDEMLRVAAVFFVMVLIGYTAFEGASWYFAQRSARKKHVAFWNFMGQFAYANMFWGLIVVLGFYAGIKITLFNKLSYYPIIDGSSAVRLVIFLVAALVYFMLVSYSIIGLRRFADILPSSFSFGMKKLPYYFASQLLFFFLMVLFSAALKWLHTASFPLFILSGLLIVMPSIVFFRIFLINLAGELAGKKKRIE